MQGRTFSPMDREEPSGAALVNSAHGASKSYSTMGNELANSAHGASKSYSTMGNEFGLDQPEDTIVIQKKPRQGWGGMKAVIIFAILCCVYFYYRHTLSKNVGVVAIPLGPKGQQKLVDTERMLLDREAEEKHSARMAQVPLQQLMLQEERALLRTENLVKNHYKLNAQSALAEEERFAAKAKKGMAKVEESLAGARRDEHKVQNVGGVYLELTDSALQGKHEEALETQMALSATYVDLDTKEKAFHTRQNANNAKHDALKKSLAMESKRSGKIGEQRALLNQESSKRGSAHWRANKLEKTFKDEEKELNDAEKRTKKLDFNGAEKLLKKQEKQEWEVVRSLAQTDVDIAAARKQGHRVEELTKQLNSEFGKNGGSDPVITKRQEEMFKALSDLADQERKLRARSELDHAKHDSLKYVLR